MVKKIWAPKPKIALYILITLVLSLALTAGIIVFSKINLPKPPAASTVNETSPSKVTIVPTEIFKTQVENELDRVATLSAKIKSANSWLTIELPKINFAVEL